MRLINLAGRLCLAVGDDGAIDVETASSGRFPSDAHGVYERWVEFRAWASTCTARPDRLVAEAELGPPVPAPRQVFAIGVNYRDHAAEAGLDLPERPMVFTKFPAAITGPYTEIVLPPGSVDFEVELVAVIGRRARNVSASDGWSYVAGLTVGQDLSERELQLSGPPPQQYNMGKSFEGFAPIGPCLVTVDEFADPDDVELGCRLAGVEMQKARTSEMVFPIPELVAYLSSVLPLLPGDLIFTGTPAGIGWARTPRRMIAAGEELITYADGVGSMRHRFVRS